MIVKIYIYSVYIVIKNLLGYNIYKIKFILVLLMDYIFKINLFNLYHLYVNNIHLIYILYIGKDIYWIFQNS